MIPTLVTPAASNSQAIENMAQKLESGFWLQMLKTASAFDSNGSFGLDQFQSYMLDVQAAALGQTQSLGLADAIRANLEGGQYNV